MLYYATWGRSEPTKSFDETGLVTMVSKQTIVAVVLSTIMVMSAGCAGWGEDGPDEPEPEGDDTADEEEQARKDTQEDTGATPAVCSGPADCPASDEKVGDSDEDSDASDAGDEALSDTPDDSDETDDPSDESDETDTDDFQDDSEDTDGVDDSDSDEYGSDDSNDSDEDDSDDSEEEHEYTYSLTVEVVDEDGNPVEGEPVHIGVESVEGDEGEYITDENGEVQFSHTGPSENEYRTFDITVRGETSYKTVYVGENTHQVTVQDSDSEEEPPNLTVTAIGPDDEPVSDQTVELYTYPDGQKVATGTTDENGEVEFDVEDSDYEIVVDTEDSEYTDYATHPLEVDGEDRTYTVQLSHPPDDGDEEETHTLTVQVFNSDEEPVEGADVSIAVSDSGEPVDEGVTDENGQVAFDVEDGAYEVSVSGTEEPQASSNTYVRVQGDDTTYNVNLYNPDDDFHPYSATIKVVDKDGNPIPNELVKAQPVDTEPQYYITDENGEIEIGFGNSSLDDGVLYEAIVRGEPHGLSIQRGVQTEEIVVSDDSDRETYDLTVHTGEQAPVENVEVTLERWDGETTTKTTGEEGQVTFDVYPGEYTVTGVDERGEEQTDDVTVPDQQEVLLGKMGTPTPEEVTTTIEVVDQDGEPIEGVTVEGITSLPPYYGEVPIQAGPTDENGEVETRAHVGQGYSIDRITDEEGNSYQLVSVGDGIVLEINEDGTTGPIVIERPSEDAQAALAVAA